MKKCKNCGKKIKEDWNFCPKCGLPQKEPISTMVNDIRNHLQDNMSFTGSIANLFSPDSKVIEVDMGKEEEKRVERIGEDREEKEVGDTVEMEGEKEWVGNRLKIECKAPGVKDLKEVKATCFGNSIEIRAYNDDTRFFKILKIPENKNIEKKEINKNRIVIHLS